MTRLLTVNGGSSSLKCALFSLDNGGRPVREATFQALDLPGNARLQVTIGDESLLESPIDVGGSEDRHIVALDAIVRIFEEDARLQRPSAVVHRVVHGGAEFAAPVFVDRAVRAKLGELSALAPLHQPVALKLIDACSERFVEVAAIACFDTGFHRDLPDVANHYALPTQYRQDGIRAYGFHGLSYESVWHQFAATECNAQKKKMIVAHLGAGASLCAIENGKSIATTMGFSALDGVPMSTRIGAIDAGVLLYLMRSHGLDAQGLEELLYRKAGLLGLSGVSGNLRDLQASTDPAAKFAIRYLIYKVSTAIGSLIAALQGLDTLVFTGGIGENNVEFRAMLCEQLAWLGVRMDADQNEKGARKISGNDSTIQVHVIPADEEGVMALKAAELLA